MYQGRVSGIKGVCRLPSMERWKRALGVGDHLSGERERGEGPLAEVHAELQREVRGQVPAGPLRAGVFPGFLSYYSRTAVFSSVGAAVSFSVRSRNFSD